MTAPLASPSVSGSYNQFDKDKSPLNGNLDGKEVTVVDSNREANKSAIRKTVFFATIVFLFLAACITCAVSTHFAPTRYIKSVETILSVIFGSAAFFSTAGLIVNARNIKCVKVGDEVKV